MLNFIFSPEGERLLPAPSAAGALRGGAGRRGCGREGEAAVGSAGPPETRGAATTADSSAIGPPGGSWGEKAGLPRAPRLPLPAGRPPRSLPPGGSGGGAKVGLSASRGAGPGLVVCTSRFPLSWFLSRLLVHS